MQRRTIFVILFSLTLLARSLPAYAASITFEGGGAYRAVWGGMAYQDILVDFGDRVTGSLGLFNETTSGSVVTSAGSVSGSAHQFSNISLLGDILTVDATHETSFTQSPPPPPIIGFEGAAISNINILFTLHDWASYRTNDLLVGNVFTDPLQEVSLNHERSLNDSEFVFSHFNNGVNGTRSGLLAPGTYRYNVLSAVHGPGQSTTMTTSFVVTHVPEPSSLLLLMFTAGLLVVSRWLQPTL